MVPPPKDSFLRCLYLIEEEIFWMNGYVRHNKYITATCVTLNRLLEQSVCNGITNYDTMTK